jgi:hypothetical protein
MNAQMDMSDQGPPHNFKGSGVAVIGFTDIKNGFVKCLLIQLDMNTLGVLNASKDKNLKVLIVECNLSIKLKNY